MKTVYVCTDTVTGLFSALHDAWKESRCADAEIEVKGSRQRQLFCEYRNVEENEHKSVRLETMIRRYMGDAAYAAFYYTLLSGKEEKGTVVFRTMQEARKIADSKKIMDHLGNPDVARVFSISREVAKEAHTYKGFVRFRELKNGVLFSEITPKARILTCIADHFADRFPMENWMIYDKTHEVFLVHKARQTWGLVLGETLNSGVVEKVTDGQIGCEKLWGTFLGTVSVRERENPRRQKAQMPDRYRRDMTTVENLHNK